MCHRKEASSEFEIELVACLFDNYSGLPVCAMRERVNRYDYSFRIILTAPEVYAILKTAGNNFLLP